MKKLPIVFLSLFLHLELSAQEDFDTRWTAANEIVNAKKYDEALVAFEPLLVEQPANTNTLVQMAWCYLLKGESQTAAEYAQNAHQIDPLNASVYFMNAYSMYVGFGNPTSGKVYLDDAVWLTPNDEDLKVIQKDIDDMKAAGLDVAALDADFNEILANSDTRNKDWTTILNKFIESTDKLNEGDNDAAKSTFKEVYPIFENVPEQQMRFAFNLTYVISTYFYNVGDSSNYMSAITKNYAYMKENRTTSYRTLLHMNTLLGEHYYNIGEYQKSFEILSEGLSHYQFLGKYRFAGAMKAQFLTQYVLSALAVGNMQEARDGGRIITELTYTGFDEWNSTNALIYIAQAWEQEDEAKAQEYFQKAYDLASESGFEDLKNGIAELLK